MSGSTPGEGETGINGGDFPAPIPWLGSVGRVAPLDAAEVRPQRAAPRRS